MTRLYPQIREVPGKEIDRNRVEINKENERPWRFEEIADKLGRTSRRLREIRKQNIWYCDNDEVTEVGNIPVTLKSSGI